MAAHSINNSSRKPSGSSTHSSGHSSAESPNHAQPPRKLAGGQAGTMFAVGMGTPASMKSSLHNGWMWGSGTPATQRNTSISSGTSANELVSSNVADGWTTSRSPSGNWDDSTGGPHRNVSHSDSQSSLSLHHTRQRQATAAQAAALSVPRIDDRSKTNQYSPQRYPSGPRKDMTRYPGSSPTSQTYNPNPYLTPQSPYEPLQSTSLVSDDLSLSLRGMVVEDDYAATASQTNQYGRQPVPPNERLTQTQPQGMYGSTDYSGYYPSQPRPETYIDYGYGYGVDPSVYNNANAVSPTLLYPGMNPQVMGVGQQPPMFFDYSGQGRGVYYPGQPMMFSAPAHSPMMTPQLAHSNTAVIADKKRDFPYNYQQHLGNINPMYVPMRGNAAAPYGGLDYSAYLQNHFVYGNPTIHTYNGVGRHSVRRVEGSEAVIARRSPLLEEFRNSKVRKWEIRDIMGYIVEFAGDQHGSRFIQTRLETATSEEKQMIFDEIVPSNALQLIQDVFGNYVIQKLMDHGTQAQKAVLAQTMEGHILHLSLQMYGCRVVQKAIEHVLSEQQGAIVKELEPHVLKCVKDANGNHVIQKLVERVSSDQLDFVKMFRGNVYDLATHPYGCRVLQRCLEHLPESHTRPLLEELHKYSINLMQDQFGNYVIQFVLEHGQPQDRALVISKLCGQILLMARHKFASNVCEKALVVADSETRRILISEIIAPRQDGSTPIAVMMKDQFANYVLQRALAVVGEEQKDTLIDLIRSQLASMRRYSSAYSKHLISIERLLDEASSGRESQSDTSQVTPPASVQA